MQKIRNAIRQILVESNSVIEDETAVRNMISSYDASPFGYTILSAVKEETGFLDELVYTITLQHTKPDFKKYVNQMAARGGKFTRIYGDTPTAKTMITRWLTGFKEGAEIDERQKSAAIKVAQVAGLDALAPLIQLIESKYDCTCVANFTGAKTKNKGLSFFEFYVFDNTNAMGSSPTEVPEQPTDIPVDDEVVKLPTEPVEAKKKRKKKKRKPKIPKLTAAQRKAGYNQINSRGDIRHVLELEQLQTIEDTIVNIITQGKYKETWNLPPDEAHDLYKDLRRISLEPQEGEEVRTFRIVDDYYEDDLPILKFYGGSVYTGARVKSKSIMNQLMSFGSHKENTFDIAKGHQTRENPTYGVDSGGWYTPPKLGGKEAKNIRRHVQQTRSGDELIIYASIELHVNPYTGEISYRTGELELYVFQIDRRFTEGE